MAASKSAPVAMNVFTHAGGVVHRDDGGALRYLLVRARRNPKEWVLPKGHIEPGETAESAAVREVREESGVIAEIVAPLGELRFGNDHIQIFLMRHVGTVPQHEHREPIWCDIESALALSTFAESRQLLTTAHERLISKR